VPRAHISVAIADAAAIQAALPAQGYEPAAVNESKR
jgi:hypothetical protein